MLMLMLVLSGCAQQEPEDVTGVLLSAPDQQQLDWIGQRVFMNECAGRTECLVHWNQGEAFPSLGIGHFIWYPDGVTGPFVESFPALIRFMQEQQVAVPQWLAERKPFTAPWPDRATFLEQSGSPEVRELREFLAATRDVQAAFIVHRGQPGPGAGPGRGSGRPTGAGPALPRRTEPQPRRALCPD